MSGWLEVSNDANVLRLRMNHAPGNTFTIDFIQEMTQTIYDNADGDDRAKVIVIDSLVDGVFSLGVEPTAIVGKDISERERVFAALTAMIEALYLGGTPVVMVVDGAAIAGGAVIASCADFVLMSPRSKVSWSEVKVGVPLPGYLQKIAQRKLTPKYFNEAILLGKNLSSQECLEAGFASAIYQDDAERDQLLDSFVGRICRIPPAVMRQSIQFQREADREALESFKKSQGAFVHFLSDQYLGKGLAALSKGKKPDF